MYNVSQQGLVFIAGIESCALKAYWDVNGYAIGFGNHQYEDGRPIGRFDTIANSARGYNLMRSHIARNILGYLNSNITVPLQQHQVDAIISLMYNGGAGKLTSTGLHRAVNTNPNDKAGIAAAFYRVSFAADGTDLRPRRGKELDLYFTGNYHATGSAYSGNNYEQYGGQYATPVIDYFVRYANDSSIHTVKDFITYWQLKITPEDLLNFKDNRQTIYKHYRKADRQTYTTGQLNLLEQGTPLKIPLDASTVKSAYQLHQTIERNEDFNAFLEKEITLLLNNPRYKRLNLAKSALLAGSTFKFHQRVSVLVWSRSLSPEESRLLDISEFVYSVATNVGKNGGNFNLRLPKIHYRNQNGNIVVSGKRQNGADFVAKQLTHTIADINQYKFVARNHDDNHYQADTQSQYFKRTNSLFEDVLQKNDLVFISYEKIGVDTARGRDKVEKQGYYENGLRWVDASALAGNTFTLMGLVDTIGSTNGNKGLEAEVTITGRDFSKVLLEDGVQFFMITYGLKNAGQVLQTNDDFARERFTIQPYASEPTATQFEKNIQLITNTALQDSGFNFFVPHTVAEFLTYVFSKLTHMPVLEGNLFKAYHHKSFIVSSQVTTDADETGGMFINYKTVEASGIWKVSKLVVDPKVADRKILDFSFVTDSGSIINYVRKICQSPFIEFWMDTYGDKFYYIVRKPPFTEAAYKSVFTLNIYEDDVESDALSYCDEVYSYYQLNPAASIIKDASNFMMYLPAVILPEYLKVFGNKMLKVDSNYLDFDLTETAESTTTLDQIKDQHRHDLDYMIECTAYLPFTRQGKIVLKGEPRVKKGMNIRYMGTGELFHVEAVGQTTGFTNEGVERLTVLEVSHGIVERHYDEYFKLVNLFRTHGENEATWTVNKPVFDKLMQRRINTTK